MTSSEIDAYVRKLGYSDEYEWVKDKPTKKFIKNGEYDTWRNQNENLLCSEYDYYSDYIYYRESSQKIYVAMLPHRMSKSEANTFLLTYGDDSVDAFFNYFNTTDEETLQFTDSNAFYSWTTSNNYVYDEPICMYDYVEYTDSSTSTVYIYVLPERMTSSEISGTRYTDNTWIKRNATKTFVLWKGYAEWKQSNSDLYENLQKYNYLTSSSGYNDSYDVVYYVKLLDKPMSHDELVAANMYNWRNEDADLVIPRFKNYHNWKTSNGYIYREYDEHYYVNGQEVDQEEYRLAQYRMIAKVLQIVLRMTNDNKADFEQFVKDGDVAVIGEAQVSDASGFFFFDEGVEDSVFDVAFVDDAHGRKAVVGAQADGVEQHVVDGVDAQELPRFFVHGERSLARPRFLGKVGQLGGDKIFFPWVSAECLADGPF